MTGGCGSPKGAKVFCFFFSKKQAFFFEKKKQKTFAMFAR
jgi:hypothetical protein